MKNYFVKNGDIQIHVMESGAPAEHAASLVVIGGIWESAERAMPIHAGLENHVVSISLRGRGLSSTPKSGYGLEEHLSDIGAVIEHLNLKDYCMLGFSRGGSYAIGWAIGHADDMVGLIIVDQPAIHRGIASEHVPFWCDMVYDGVPVLNHIRKEAIIGMSKDAILTDFESGLSSFYKSMVLFRGTNPHAVIPSNLDDESISIYRKQLKKLKIVDFNGSGHMIPDDEPEKYIQEIGSFLESLS